MADEVLVGGVGELDDEVGASHDKQKQLRLLACPPEQIALALDGGQFGVQQS
ncbi:hypothetical protein D3C87_1236720 [compost metagenome]